MHFFRSPSLWSALPALKAGVMHVQGVRAAPDFNAPSSRISKPPGLQSSFSAVSSSTESVLIMIEAFHDGASAAVAAALLWLEEAFFRLPGCTTRSRELFASTPDFQHP